MRNTRLARRDPPLLADGTAGLESADKLHKPTVVEIKEAMFPGTALNPEVRRLQAEVVEAASGHPRRYAFAPGSKHVVMVHIGPGDAAGPLAIETAFPDHEVRRDDTGGAVLQVAFVSEGPKGIVVQTQPLPLPPTGPTRQVWFHLVVAPDAADVRCSLLVFQGTRLLQSAELSGPVATRDHPVDGRQLCLLRTADVVPMPIADSSPPQFDASLSFHVGTIEEALLVDPERHHLVIHAQGLNEFHEQIVSLLRIAVDDEAHDGMAPGSPQQEAALRSLARHGNTFYQRLQPELKGDRDQDERPAHHIRRRRRPARVRLRLRVSHHERAPEPPLAPGARIGPLLVPPAGRDNPRCLPARFLGDPADHRAPTRPWRELVDGGFTGGSAAPRSRHTRRPEPGAVRRLGSGRRGEERRTQAHHRSASPSTGRGMQGRDILAGMEARRGRASPRAAAVPAPRWHG